MAQQSPSVLFLFLLWAQIASRYGKSTVVNSGLGVLLGEGVLKPHLKTPAHKQSSSQLQFGPDTNPFLMYFFFKHHRGLSSVIIRFLLVTLIKILFLIFFP